MKDRGDRVIINLKNIFLEYEGKNVFSDLSYEFVNKLYILQGESGCGKTTLLNLICGYVQPQKGIIEGPKEDEIDYLFQDCMLFNNLTVRENLYIKAAALKLQQMEEKTVDSCKKFGIEKLLNKPVYMLSGGEKQRVQMAIIALEEKSVLLLDEPIANLDKKNSDIIMNYVYEMTNKLVIMVSHQYVSPSIDYTLLELREGKLYEI